VYTALRTDLKYIYIYEIYLLDFAVLYSENKKAKN
jgi:hypothetical protein